MSSLNVIPAATSNTNDRRLELHSQMYDLLFACMLGCTSMLCFVTCLTSGNTIGVRSSGRELSVNRAERSDLKALQVHFICNDLTSSSELQRLESQALVSLENAMHTV